MINDSKNSDWHKHEKRIKEQLNQYFNKKGYLVSFNRYYDTFDVIVAKTNDDLTIGELIGIEIKSDKDNIMRAKDQLIRYIRIFDKIYLALENKEVPEFIPPFIGIIRCNSHIEIEREAQNIYSGVDFGFTINYSAIKNTIKESNGIKSRSKELMAYLTCLEEIKRKLLYNSLFYDNQIPFSKKEKKAITFISKNHKEMINMDLFDYSYGNVSVSDK
jgi:hypothetical protein